MLRPSLSVVLGSLVAIAVAVACGSGGSGGATGGGGDGGGGPMDSGGSSSGSLADGSHIFGGDSSLGNVASLYWVPASATVHCDGSKPQSASFTLHAKLQGGGDQVIAAQSVAFDRPDLASVMAGSPVVLTAPGLVAGIGTLQGVYGNMVATAKLEVAVKTGSVGMGVTAGQQVTLDGATTPDPALTALQYPYDKTVFPLGLTSPLVMWAAPNPSGDVYRVEYAEKDYVYDDYEVVTAPAQVRIAQAAWDRITASNQGDPLKVTLSRLDASSGNAYESATETWTIAPASMQGAIYYWTTSAGGHMSRIQPGTGATPQTLYSGACMGCHAVSSDGSTLVASVEGAGTTSGSPPGPNQTQDQSDGRPWVTFALPAANATKISTDFSGNVAVNNDGKYVVFGDQTLYLADTATAQLYTSTGLDNFVLDTGMSGLMTPAFSPDGKHLVAVEGAGSAYHNLYDGKLVELDFDEATHTFSNPQSLAATSLFPTGQQGVAYPTFSPDAKWIAFHVGDYDTGCDTQGCDANATQIGAIYLQSTSGAMPVRLTTLTDSSPNAADHDETFEPTFNPVQRGNYFWVVVSSSRDWGNRITGTPNNGKKRLWVAAIDASPASGADPSHPAFFLEGQEEDTENMRGFWSLAQCTPTPKQGGGGGSCTAGFQCCSGFCDMGTCTDQGNVSCVAVGGTCSASTDCCNSPAVVCNGGTCQVANQ